MSPPLKPDTTLKSLLSSLAVVTGALLVCGAVVAGWLQLSPTLLLERAEPPAQLEEPGRAYYANVTARLVGAMRIESFSSASASGPHGERVVGRGLMAGGEAICIVEVDGAPAPEILSRIEALPLVTQAKALAF